MSSIVKNELKQYKFGVILLYFLMAFGVILIIAGVGVYFYIGKLTVGQWLLTTSVKNFRINEIRMLYDYSRVLGIVFSLVGIAVIIVALDKLSSVKSAYKMASFIKKTHCW